MVREKNGTWSLPGGWVDVNVSVRENVYKRSKGGGRTGCKTGAGHLQSRTEEKHNLPVYAYKVCKIFVLCSACGGEFQENIETTESRYLDGMNFQGLPKKRIIKNRSRCVLRLSQ